FTTFSTFNLDVLKNMQANLPIEAVIYYFSSIIFGFVFAMLGMKIGKKVGQLVRKERNTR
ncbi:MAG: chromosome condensation protein CrcB, partial [Lactobacillus crispatus]|nr:chromosome condensation protein CrcB [Lactobacillus crispatus]